MGSKPTTADRQNAREAACGMTAVNLLNQATSLNFLPGGLLLGHCIDAKCSVPYSNKKSGLDCQCLYGDQQKVTWVGDQATNECHDWTWDGALDPFDLGS